MLPKAHLTSHSKMSGSRWVITQSWLSGSLRSFSHSSPVYSCHLVLIPSASVTSILLLSFIVPIFAWNVHLVSLISLKRSLVFPILLFSSISLHWSLRKAFLSLLVILWNSAFRWIYVSFSPLPFTSLLYSAICKDSSANHFYCGWFWSLPPVQWYEPPSIVLQALFLSDLIPWIYLSLPLYKCKGFDLGYLNGLVVFPTFFNLSLNLVIRSSWSDPQSASGLIFADCIESFSIFGCKGYNQSDFSIGHLVMSMCGVISCVFGRGCLPWPVCSLGRTLLAFALLHSVLQGQISCYPRCFLTSYFCIPVPYNEKDIFLGC